MKVSQKIESFTIKNRDKKYLLSLLVLIIAFTGSVSIINSKAEVSNSKFIAEVATQDLDPTGKTVPKSGYIAPGDAVYMATNGNDSNNGTTVSTPVKTVNRAVALAKVTTSKTIVIRGGEYRDNYKSSDASGVGMISHDITFQAYPNESPWFVGTDIINNGWTASGNVWVRDWSTPQFCRGTYYNLMPNNLSQINQTSNQYDGSNNCTWWDSARDPLYPVAADPQLAFANNIQLDQKGTLAEVVQGSKTFYYDWNNKKIYISENPAQSTIELATRGGFATFGGAYNFAVKGVGFKRFASSHKTNPGSAVIYIGLNGTVANGQAQFEKIVMTENAGATLAFSGPKNNTFVKNSVFAFNHGGGIGANGFANGSRGINGAPAPKNNFTIESSIFNPNHETKKVKDASVILEV